MKTTDFNGHVRLSREAEAEVPAFDSYQAAVKWFEDEYGAAFTPLKDVFEVDEDTCYEHHIIVNIVAYVAYMKQLQNRDSAFAVPMEALLSYHPVQIMGNGSVHIVF